MKPIKWWVKSGIAYGVTALIGIALMWHSGDWNSVRIAWIMAAVSIVFFVIGGFKHYREKSDPTRKTQPVRRQDSTKGNTSMEKAIYLTDDRDLHEEDLRTLVIFPGGNGDWYVQVAPKNGVALEGVRICTSGGASTNCPGLGPAIADAYRAMMAAQRGEKGPRIASRSELEEEVSAWRARFPDLKYEFLEIVPVEV